MDPQLQRETSWLQPHAPIVKVAAKALADRNIPVVEYGQQIQWRNGDPVVLLLVEWAVPDALLSLSSQILSDHGFSCVPPSTRVTDIYGQWERACIIHKLAESSPVYLYPLSFVGLALQDTVEVTSTFDRILRILTPKPQIYMVSLIRHLLNHPVGDSFRFRVKDDLLSFISFYILRDKPLNTKEGECDDDESEEDFQKRLGDAVREMKTWDWGAGRYNYLCIAESIVRDCRSIEELSNC
ncbi:hypothetical protein N7474_004740 [Penicillium riverlandense]|uniref:uncharacterized protein n=1 Tax=Penicillium riverlandense TaxID=1903569 RepID=UPI0025466497|nr:uncharacterized protein N7474_004740 [Penicillium riverlandense]KAJ5819149.1 hypothetical protein N7474_004740 [Penicillium riverlandense]